jgi:signal peptidase
MTITTTAEHATGPASARRAPAAVTTVRRWLNRVSARRLLFRTILGVFISLILVSYIAPLWFQIQGEQLLVVTSGSMEPEIGVGDAVVIRPITDPSQVRIGQIVTFWSGVQKRLVTHRVIALKSVVRQTLVGNQLRPTKDQSGNVIEDPFIKTKGDNNVVPDPDLTPVAQVQGIVQEAHAGWGYLLAWAHSPTGRLLLFAPPLLMLLGAELLSRTPERYRTAPWHRRTQPSRRFDDEVPVEEVTGRGPAAH